jgi:hypothetical protein
MKEKQTLWQKINYNFIANKRYFESQDWLYHQALELRLLYSVIEIVCGYFAFRDILWEGEKNAIQRLKNNFPDFYKLLEEYLKVSLLKDRFNLYSQMVDLVFTDDFKKWSPKDQIVIIKDFLVLGQDDSRTNYAKSLFE